MLYPKIRQKIAIIFILCFANQISYSQSDSVQWFAPKCVFPFLEYDLLEVQPFTGVMSLKSNEVDFEGLYIPVNIGFRKSLIQWSMLSMRFDFSFGAASFSQFDVVITENDNLKGGLLNTDFKASGYLSAVKNKHHFRIQLFHMSSHLGDNYMIRHGDLTPNDKSLNYEQLDLTYLYSFEQVDLYGGMGMVIGTNTFRKRFMSEIGLQGRYPLKQNWSFAYGFDVKFYDENEFRPDIHYGLGFTFSQRAEHQINVSVDGFIGQMPYSTLDYGQIYWIGLSSRLYL